MEELLSNNDKVEVAINLDQNVGFQVVWIAFSFWVCSCRLAVAKVITKCDASLLTGLCIRTWLTSRFLRAQEHFGVYVPVLLASLHCLWAVRACRPYTPKASPWDQDVERAFFFTTSAALALLVSYYLGWLGFGFYTCHTSRPHNLSSSGNSRDARASALERQSGRCGPWNPTIQSRCDFACCSTTACR